MMIDRERIPTHNLWMVLGKRLLVFSIASVLSYVITSLVLFTVGSLLSYVELATRLRQR